MIYLVNTGHSSIFNFFIDRQAKKEIEIKKRSNTRNYSSRSSSNSSARSSASQSPSPNSTPIRENKKNEFEYRVIPPSSHKSKSRSTYNNSYSQNNKNKRSKYAYQTNDSEMPIFEVPRYF